MGSIGSYVMITLLAAGAVYAMANKGKPRPSLTQGKKTVVIVCAGIAILCGLVILLAILVPPTPSA